MIEKDPRRAMQLAYDYPFRTVDDKRTILCHQGNFAKINLLLFYVTDLSLLGGWIEIKDEQANDDPQRGSEGHPLLDTFLLVVTHFPNLVAYEFQ